MTSILDLNDPADIATMGPLIIHGPVTRKGTSGAISTHMMLSTTGDAGTTGGGGGRKQLEFQTPAMELLFDLKVKYPKDKDDQSHGQHANAPVDTNAAPPRVRGWCSAALDASSDEMQNVFDTLDAHLRAAAPDAIVKGLRCGVNSIQPLLRDDDGNFDNKRLVIKVPFNEFTEVLNVLVVDECGKPRTDPTREIPYGSKISILFTLGMSWRKVAGTPTAGLSATAAQICILPSTDNNFSTAAGSGNAASVKNIPRFKNIDYSDSAGDGDVAAAATTTTPDVSATAASFVEATPTQQPQQQEEAQIPTSSSPQLLTQTSAAPNTLCESSSSSDDDSDKGGSGVDENADDMQPKKKQKQ